MAYTRGMLNRYADTIEEEGPRNAFKDRVATIEFDRAGGGELCSAGAFAEAMDGSLVAGLANDFRERFLEFINAADL
jgi:hypothetical protein